MDDVNTGAGSSSAQTAIPKDPVAYAKWRAEGPSALATPKPEGESAPQNDKSAAASAAEKHAPASEAGKGKQEKPRSNAESRLSEILDDLRTAGLTPAELKTFKRQAQQDQQPKRDGAAAPPEKTVQPAKLEPPKKPKQDDFKTWDEYEAARDKYVDDMSEYTRKVAVEDFQASQREANEQKELSDKISDAKKRYGDEAEGTIRETAKAVFADKSVNGIVKAMLNESPHLVDLAYVLGSKPEELADFIELAGTNPGAAIRKLVLMEKLVSEELAKGGKSEAEPEGKPARGEDGKFQPVKGTPVKQVTKAPAPGTEVGGNNGPPPDAVDSAFKSGNFRNYMESANRRDLAHRQGR